jgi:hypothetical protein
MPSARRRKERRHVLDVIADEGSAPPTPAITEVPDTPDVSGNKVTRTTRVGETVRRATFWFTDEDLEAIASLQRVVNVPGVSGVPDKSAVVREAIRRMAADHLRAGEVSGSASERRGERK